jgi:predicted nucleotidyltransferase
MNISRELPPQIYEICGIIVDSIKPERVYLFGSYAYGTPREDSDYDFYAVLPNDCPMRRHEVLDKARLSVFDDRLKNKRPFHPYDLLANKKRHFEKLCSEPTLMKIIAQQGIILYDSFGSNEKMV